MKRTKPVENQKGRPREFDTNGALDAAMRVFWEKGYDGASLSDLETAMGINRPSLYAAFGNKEELFRKSLERYSASRSEMHSRALAAPTARQVVETLLAEIVDRARDAKNPSGCLLIRGAMSCANGGSELQETIAAIRASSGQALQKRFKRAIAEGDLPRDTDPVGLARYVQAVSSGMAVQASMGASAEDLKRIAELVLSRWPS